MLCSKKLLSFRANVAGVALLQGRCLCLTSRRMQQQQYWQQQSRTGHAAFVPHCSSKESSTSSRDEDTEGSTADTTPYPPPSEQQNPKQSSPFSHGPRTPLGSGPPDPETPRGPNLNPQLQRLLVLLTEFGGIYGTAAVAIAWFTNVDPFGDLHWNLNHILFGLQTFIPLLVLDAALMLPDYSLGPEDSQAVSGLMFGDPEAINTLAGLPSKEKGDEASAAADDVTQTTILPSSSSSSSSSGSGENLLLRLQMALELLQQVYTRANPGIGLNPLNEFMVVCVAALADEMLYRAVGLTLLGLWLRDRLYEAGVDESVNLGWISNVTQLPAEMATPEFARYAAIAVIAGLGAAGFAAGALREMESIKRLQVLNKDGEASEASEALKAQLVASLGSQNLVMYGVEGVREVTASVMAGVAYVATGNLAAPLAGSIVVQTLFSAYQRLSLGRAREKRKAMLDKMKQRSNKLQAAMEAAVAAKQAAAAEATTSDKAPAAEEKVEEAASSSSSSSGPEEKAGDKNVDFLTAVLLEAEKQQKQQQEQQRAAAAAAAAAASPNSSSSHETAERSTSSSSSSSSHAASAHDASISSSGHTSSSLNGAASSSGDSSSSSHDPEAVQQQLSVLLEDMLRSPEGSRVVQKWIAGQHSADISSSSSSSSSSQSSGHDPQQAVEQLLADPETKAKLLKELEDQLFVMSELQQQRAKREQRR